MNTTKVRPRSDLLMIGMVASLLLPYLFLSYLETKWMLVLSPVIFLAGYLLGVMAELDFAERGGRD